MGTSIGQMAGRFGLSRSTLLYYDSIGLLIASQRSRCNYRIYSDDDVRRMEQIAVFREAGLPLQTIAELLDSRPGRSAAVLEERLMQIHREIRGLRQQQRILVELLRNPELLRKSQGMTKQRWISLLAASGMDDEQMRRWHIDFERQDAGAHQDFLESLGIAKAEIRAIRRWAQADLPAQSAASPA